MSDFITYEVEELCRICAPSPAGGEAALTGLPPAGGGHKSDTIPNSNLPSRIATEPCPPVGGRDAPLLGRLQEVA